jgi:hypothetical protein
MVTGKPRRLKVHDALPFNRKPEPVMKTERLRFAFECLDGAWRDGFPAADRNV